MELDELKKIMECIGCTVAKRNLSPMKKQNKRNCLRAIKTKYPAQPEAARYPANASRLE